MATFIRLTDANNRQPVLVHLSLVTDIRPLEQGMTLEAIPKTALYTIKAR